MKNIFLPLVFMLAIITTQAQKRSDRSENRRELATQMNPEKIAVIQAKKLTLALDLNDQQQKEISGILIANRSNRLKNKVNKEEFKSMTAEQQAVIKEKRLDQKIATKRAFKDIMTQDQYAKFEKMAKQKRGDRRYRIQKVRRG